MQTKLMSTSSSLRVRMSLSEIYPSCSSLKKQTDEALFLELARRGHDLSKLRDEETTAQIVRIG